MDQKKKGYMGMGKEDNSCKSAMLKVLVLLVLSIFCYFNINMVVNASEINIENVKQGIIEVHSGFLDETDKFHQLNSASGYLISRSEGNVYIISNYNIVHNSNKDKKKYCKKNDINYKKENFKDYIEVVIKGDVTVEAEVFAESKQQNYVILQVNTSISEKDVLKLGNSDELEKGEIVYTIGFSENRENIEFYKGELQAVGVTEKGKLYIQHTASVTSGNTGGPLIDENGYVIGMNNVKLNKKNKYYALPINEIRLILDNFQIDYESKEETDSKNALKNMIYESELLVESNLYKKKSKQELKSVLEKVQNLIENEELEKVAVEGAIEELQQAKSLLVLKMEMTKKIMIVLAIVILFQVIYFVNLLIKYYYYAMKIREKNKNQIIECDEFVLENMVEGKKNKLPVAYLKRISTGQRMLIKRRDFYIGSKIDAVDYVIENSVISRQHAVISYQEGKFYISDYGSSNGTFVNGVEVIMNEKLVLNDGDKVFLADEEFEFKLGED